jgi:hypothetical protein
MAVGLSGCYGVNMAGWRSSAPFEVVQDEGPKPQQAVYCYNNLGHSPDCYDVPLEPEARRLMEYYGPAPEVRGYYGRRAF